MINNCRKSIIRIMTVVITIVMILVIPVVLGNLPGKSMAAYAASEKVGKLTINGEATEYDNVNSLLNKAKSLGGKTFTIDMYTDWGNSRLIVPARANVTFNMHGHMFNRGLTSYRNDGEVVYLDSGSTCTINGGSTNAENSTNHTVNLYNGTSTSTKANWKNVISGGVIAGGYSSNGGGGIDMNKSATLILNRVTIAGCRAEQTWQSDGYGGGIRLQGAGTITMNRSTIKGCYAYNDGGGIYQCNQDNFILEMNNNSNIEYNYCEDEGGGICIDGEASKIIGDGESYIQYNENGGSSDDNGGGIYLWNDDATVSGVNIYHNKGGKGGGIYAKEEDVSISDCNISSNYSYTDGGGIFVENDNTTINNCTITGNEAKGAGCGVAVAIYVDTGFKVTGKTVIRGNMQGNTKSNLCVSNNSRVNFNLMNGADVSMRYVGMYDTAYMVTEGKAGDTHKSPNCIRFLSCDVDGYHFTFNDAPNQRKIYLVKDGIDDERYGSPYVPGKPTVISPEEAKPKAVGGETVTGTSGKKYNLIRGYFHYPKIDDEEVNSDAVFYYSDGYFDSDSKQYNEHITTASYALAMSGMYLSVEDYPYKHSSGRQFLSDIGVDDQNIYINDYNIQKPGTDSIGVIIGSKELTDNEGNGTGEYLIPIAVRGAGYEAEWASNVLLGKGLNRDGEAQGFSEAADHVEEQIEYYINKYGLADEIEAGNVKFWISGFSRAGATSNLTAKRLVEKYACSEEGKNNEVFAYCIEAPQGGTDNAETLSDKKKYYCIHNLINKADIVPLVGPSRMGFKRYGVDHYLPGGEAG